MKKLITVLSCALLFIALGASAQSGYLKRASDSKTTDTLTNAATSNLQLPISGYQNVVSIQALVTKLTGTTGGNVFLYGSNDGTNYVVVPSKRNDGATRLDTLILANSAGVQSKIFRVENSPYTYYQLRTVGTGTQTTKIQAFAIWRKQ